MDWLGASLGWLNAHFPKTQPKSNPVTSTPGQISIPQKGGIDCQNGRHPSLRSAALRQRQGRFITPYNSGFAKVPPSRQIDDADESLGGEHGKDASSQSRAMGDADLR